MAAYYVSGNGNPSPNGYYFDAGEYDGKRYYERQDAAYAIWWKSEFNVWRFSTTPGTTTPGFWYRSTTIDGDYIPLGDYTGTPTAVKVADGALCLAGVGK